MFFISVVVMLHGQSKDTFKTSEIFSDKIQTLPLNSVYQHSKHKSDTLLYHCILQNDSGRDTSFFLFEQFNEYIHCNCKATSKHNDFIFTSGRSVLKDADYSKLFIGGHKIALPEDANYFCTFKVLGLGFLGAYPMNFMSEMNYLKTSEKYRVNYGQSDIVNYIYITLMVFNIIILSVIFFISKNNVFRTYIFYLVSHLIYGLYLIDLNSWIGSYYPRNFIYKYSVTEAIIFIGQAIYIYFVYQWLEIEKYYKKYKLFFMISIGISVAYVLLFEIVFFIDERNPDLKNLVGLIRLIGLFIQCVFLYLVIFKIKNKMKYFILAGSLSVVFFGVVFGVGSTFNIFDGYKLANISSGGWYMIGGMFEVLFFSLGLGYYYYTIQAENAKLLIDKLEAVNEKLRAEEEKLNDRIRISQDLHDQIGSTLSSIAVYSQVAQQIDKNEQVSLGEVLDKIANASNEMTTEISDIVWAIHPKNDNLEKIVDRMYSFAKPMALVRMIDFRISYDESLSRLTLSMDQRKNIFLIFKEAVTNAIKYACAKAIVANLNVENNYFILTVTDDGIGFDVDAELNNTVHLSGNGLINMRARAMAIKGVLDIQSNEKKGTKVTLTFDMF